MVFNISINTEDFNVIRDQAGDIALNPAVEKEFQQLLKARNAIEEIYEQIQIVLSEMMNENNLKKIISGNVIVKFGVYGERYDVAPDTPKEFIKVINYEKANPEEIDKFVKINNQLPPGVTLKQRAGKCSLRLREFAGILDE